MPPALAAVLVAVVFVLHQDLWFWRTASPMVFGVMPIGLFYHAAFTVVCSLLMALLVRYMWPAHLEAGFEPRSGEGPRSIE